MIAYRDRLEKDLYHFATHIFERNSAPVYIFYKRNQVYYVEE